MYKHTDVFIKFCKENLSIQSEAFCEYQSLSACIIDCVYSLRAQYSRTTVSVVEKYACKYMEDGNRFAANDTVSDLINNIEEAGGPKKFANEVLKNRQQSGGVIKSEVCLHLAKYLSYLNINTIKDFRDFESPELLEVIIHAVKGIGDAGTNYLFMLAGDPIGASQIDMSIIV